MLLCHCCLNLDQKVQPLRKTETRNPKGPESALACVPVDVRQLGLGDHSEVCLKLFPWPHAGAPEWLWGVRIYIALRSLEGV